MARTKVNQHYVPRSFMRAWADDDKKVKIYHITQRREVARNPLTQTCADNYFYSTNTAVETKLGDLNGKHMYPLNHIRDGGSLIALDDRERSLLKSFAAVQRMRTEQMREGVYASGADFIRDIIKRSYADEIPDKKTLEIVADYEIDKRMVSAHHLLLQHGILGFLAFDDLGMLLLRNETEREFICSDAPVVLDNPRFKKSRELSYAGIANTGLVVYCPISPDELIVLYDPQAYKVVASRRDKVEVTDPAVVDDLNYLQLVSANDIAFYNSTDEAYVQDIHRRVDHVEETYEVEHKYEFESGYSVEQRYSPPEQIPTLTAGIDELAWKPGGGEYTIERDSPMIGVQYRLAQKIREVADSDEEHLIKSINCCLQIHDAV